MKEGIDADQILHRIAAMDALVLWVVDLFDFEASLLEGMNRHLLGKDIVLVATKRDLLPETLSPHKLGQFLLQRLDQMQIRVRALVVTGRGIEGAQQEVMRAMQLAGGRDIVVIGHGQRWQKHAAQQSDEHSAADQFPLSGHDAGFQSADHRGFSCYRYAGTDAAQFAAAASA